MMQRAKIEKAQAKYTHATCLNQLSCGFFTPGSSLAMRLPIPNRKEKKQRKREEKECGKDARANR